MFSGCEKIEKLDVSYLNNKDIGNENENINICFKKEI